MPESFLNWSKKVSKDDEEMRRWKGMYVLKMGGWWWWWCGVSGTYFVEGNHEVVGAIGTCGFAAGNAVANGLGNEMLD